MVPKHLVLCTILAPESNYVISYEKNDASYNLPKLIKSIFDLPHILTWNSSFLRSLQLFLSVWIHNCQDSLTSWIINLLTNQILQLSCKILNKAVKLRTHWMWIFNILHCINYRMGLGWCKLLMARTHTKKGNKERKNKRGSQDTIRHFQPDKRLNISTALIKRFGL